jgi:DNA/RNA endonuclease G (NUC1)
MPIHFPNPTSQMRLPRLRSVRPIVVTLALLSCTENGPVGPNLDTSARFNTQGTSQSVVISQVYGGGGNSGATIKNDFIEIFNNGNDAVNLAGWSLQYASSAGNFNASPNVPTPLSGSLAPGQYLLVQEAAGAGGTVNLSPDIIATTAIPMSATDAKVALVRTTTAITCGATATPCGAAQLTQVADLVGYGTANLFEGTAAVGALSATQGAFRNAAGCSDTDKNSVDFTRGAPAPRNRATPLNVCPAVAVAVDHVTVGPVAPATGTVAVGATVQFKATAFDASNNDISGSVGIAYTTSPTGFATVDGTGLVTGAAVGTTTVVATAGGKSASSPLTVTAAAPVDNGDVVISQVYGGGGNANAQYLNDYVEILNKGDNAVNLAGWSVQYSAATASSYQVTALTGTIQPGHYFLIQEASGGAVGGANPAAELSGGINLSATTGKVILARTTTAQSTSCPTTLVVDMIGYGGANCSASTDWKGTASAPSNTTAEFRKGDGCTNSGNAANDFSVAAPTPRNSTSPTKRCAAPTPLPSVHFSELHYDNSGPGGLDVNEKIEIAGPAGTDLTGWSVVLYGGDATPDFSAYSTTDLGVSIPATCGLNGVIVIDYNVNGIKNAKFGGVGNPAGMALIDNNNQVVEFLSYEGTFTALDGPAAGHLSVDMGVAEEPPPAPGNSLHRDDLGVWQNAAPQDFGACNAVNATPAPANAAITFGVSTPSDTLPVGFDAQIFPTEKNGSGVTVTTSFTWVALTPAVASVDADGVMHGLSAGTATFQATATDGTTATYSQKIVSFVPSTTADWSGNLEFGTPTDNSPTDDHIITHDQFTSSYSYERNGPNWVSAKIDITHYGTGSDRCNCFTFDPAVPATLHYTTNAYTGVGTIWNRGHLLRSADVEASPSDNAVAYYFSNIAPQSAQMNQGPWAIEENFLGDLAKTGGKDVYEIMGVSGSQGTLKGVVGAPNIPQWFWKVAVIVPHGRKLADIHRDDDLQVIAVIMPNVASVNSDWTTYKTTVDAVEALSGYDLLNALPTDIQAVVESNDQPPTAAMTAPAAGNEGSALSFSGSGSTDPDAGDVLTYSWDFGDHTSATGVTPSHTFTDDGQYIVTLTVRDQIGAKRSTTAVVTVSNIAPAGLFASPAPVNEGQSFTLSIANATDPSTADAAAGFSYRFDCGGGFGDWTSSSSVSCFAADNPGSAVAAEVKDKDNGTSHYSGAVAVSNVSPTAIFSNNGPLDEGTGFTLRLDGASDPSPTDNAVGLQYRFNCGNGVGPWQLSPSAFCPAADDGTFSVSGEVKDKDDGESVYSGTVVVNNVAPTADFTNNGPVNEGQTFTLSLANANDVSSVDLAAGLEFRFDCGTGGGVSEWSSSASVTCPAADHGVYNVAGEVRDKNHSSTAYAGAVTVINVAPTATFTFNHSVNEGSPFTLTMSGATDSPRDVAAGLEYRFNCGTIFGDWSSAPSVSCPTNDNGTSSVSAEVRDAEHASTAYTGAVIVNSIAPTGTFSTSAPVHEGSGFTLSIAAGSDVSSADIAAGLSYRFDCGTGDGFNAWGSSPTVVCAGADNPGYQTKGEIRDKDDAFSSYAAFSGVTNVNPSVQVDPASAIVSGGTFTLAGGFADPGQNDGPWTYVINWGDGNSSGSTNAQGAIAGSHQYFIAGSYTVTLTVKDKDGGVGSASTTVQVGRVTGAMDVNPNQISIGNNGNGQVIATVFGGSQFNAGAINLGSVRIGRTAPDTQGNGALKVEIADVNHDGILDMVAHFQRSALVANGDISGGSTQLSVDATLNDGRQIRATGGVSVKN